MVRIRNGGAQRTVLELSAAGFGAQAEATLGATMSLVVGEVALSNITRRAEGLKVLEGGFAAL